MIAFGILVRGQFETALRDKGKTTAVLVKWNTEREIVVVDGYYDHDKFGDKVWVNANIYLELVVSPLWEDINCINTVSYVTFCFKMFH